MQKTRSRFDLDDVNGIVDGGWHLATLPRLVSGFCQDGYRSGVATVTPAAALLRRARSPVITIAAWATNGSTDGSS